MAHSLSDLKFPVQTDTAQVAHSGGDSSSGGLFLQRQGEQLRYEKYISNCPHCGHDQSQQAEWQECFRQWSLRQASNAGNLAQRTPASHRSDAILDAAAAEVDASFKRQKDDFVEASEQASRLKRELTEERRLVSVEKQRVELL